MTLQRLEGHSRPPGLINVLTGGLREYRWGKQLAEEYLNTALFSHEPVPSGDKKERMIKLAATTLLMQRLNCNLLGITPTVEMKKQFMLIGAIIDPYDGAMDNSDLESSLRFCTDLFQAFDTKCQIPESINPSLTDEARFYSYLSVLEKEIPKSDYFGFWKTLKAMHMIQTITLFQRKDVQTRLGVTPSGNDLFELSRIKGGLNAILFASLIDSDIADLIPEVDFPETFSIEELVTLRKMHVVNGNLYNLGQNLLADAIYTAGAFVQHIDDFEDVPDDIIEGVQTAFTLNPGMSYRFLKDIPKYMNEIRKQFLAAGKSNQDTGIVMHYLGLFLARKVFKRIKNWNRISA